MLKNKKFFLENGNEADQVTSYENSVILDYPCGSTDSCTNYFTFLDPGTYVFETWGAQGGYNGGKGGYSFGIIGFSRKTLIKIFVGQKGQEHGNKVGRIPSSFNGGGSAYTAGSYRYAGAGGGGTDIRISSNSLFNRIIVSGGGGGSTADGTQSELDYHQGSYAGGISGGNTEEYIALGANQTSPGIGSYEYGTCSGSDDTYSGAFGYGGETSSDCTGSTYGGGGGGWYGGASGKLGSSGPGAGGSGFVLTHDSTLPSGYFKEHWRYYMSNPVLISGNSVMPKCEGELNLKTLFHNNNETGHSGNGCVRISMLSVLNQFTCNSKRNIYNTLLLTYTILFLEIK